MKTSKFLMEVVDILVDYIRKNNDRSCKVNGQILARDDNILMSYCCLVMQCKNYRSTLENSYVLYKMWSILFQQKTFKIYKFII